MGMSYWECFYRTVGEDAVFFLGLPEVPAVPALPTKIARCGLAQAACDGATGMPLTPTLWMQCGHVAGPGPDGGYLCERLL